MSNVLAERIQSVRRQIRKTLTVDGVARLIAVLVGSACFVGVVDYLLHVNDAGIRCVLLIGILGWAAFVAWRWLWVPLHSRLSDVQVACVVEEHNGDLNNRLSTTVAFLNAESDARVGSPELQRHVISQTLDELDRVSFGVVDDRGSRRAMKLALALCALVAGLFLWRPLEASVAVRRLATPFAHNPWPQKTELQFITENAKTVPYDRSQRVARGSRLDVFVENSLGQLPDDARLEIQFARQRDVVERELKSTSLLDVSGVSHDAGNATIVCSAGPIVFRAVGGDDEGTPWQRVDVVPPPRAESLRVAVIPPEYIGQPKRELPSGQGHLETIVGSQVEFSATASVQVAQAMLHVANQPSQQLAVSRDRRISGSFSLSEAGVSSWWIELTDAEGFTNASDSRFEARATADRVPDVFIEEPESDLQVTSTADVPLRVVARDDLGVQKMRIVYRVGLSEDSEQVTIPLESFVEMSEESIVDHTWSLDELQPPQGTRILFHAEATDHFDGDEPHVGRSVPRALIVVSPEDKEAEIALRQSELLEELERVTELQEKVANQTGELELQLTTAGAMRRQDLDLLKRVELDQRRIASRLADDDDGLHASTKQLLSELEANRIDSTATRGRLANLARQLELTGREFLPDIDNQLTRARKSIENRDADSDDASDSNASNDSIAATGSDNSNAEDALASARSNQEAVLDTLTDAIRNLSEWKQRRDVVGDLQEVIESQETLQKETTELGNTTLGQSTTDLTPQQQVDLAKLSKRQERMAEELEETAETLQQLDDRMEDSGTTLEGALEAAREALRNQATAGRMQRAADEIGQNRMGDASKSQQEILEQLEQVRDLLEDRPSAANETLAQTIEESRDELQRLRQEQAELLEKLDEAEQMRKRGDDVDEKLETLQQKQQQLQRELQQQEQQLQRLWMRRAADAASRASERMQQLSEQMQTQDPSAETLQQSGEEVLEELDRAIRETQLEVDALREQLDREAVEKMTDTLDALVKQQQSVIEETQRLNELVVEQGRLRRSQLRTLVDVEETQRMLAEETKSLSDAVSSARAVQLALTGAARRMESAADLLADRETGESTLQVEQSALKRLVALAEIMSPPESEQNAESGDDDEQPEEQEENQNAPPPGESISLVAQLQLVRTMQQDLLDRTQKLEGADSADRAAVASELAAEQGELADLAEELLEEYLNDPNTISDEPPAVEPMP